MASREQERIEELWEASRRTYGEARRRELCALWISYHERLVQRFHDHAERHQREQERYERLLKSMYTTQGAA